jgi:NAD(P)-dependent dehydrogenase (short-subunit alcohol dehydrogenase family)
MMAHGSGSIVNTSSVLGYSPSPKLFATHGYAMTKAAILGFTTSAAAYYAAHGIRLNTLAPGLIRTPMAQRAAESAATLAYLKDKQPLTGDLGEASDCAAAALFLLSDASRFVTGVTLPVDGGWSVCG